MRYAVVYLAGTVNVVAYVHLHDDGTVRLQRPPRLKQLLTVDYPAPGVARRPFPEPDWACPHGPGPDGATYHG